MTLRVRDVQASLASLHGGWRPPEDGVDRVIAGDAGRAVAGVAVMWMSYRWALERAVALGCDLVITHEPTFYDHHDRDPASLALASARAKAAYLEEHGVTVVRCHDLWDAYPGLGVPDAWGRALGLGPAVAATEFLRVHEVPETSAEAFARRVARAVAPWGQEAVQLVGPAEARVRRVSVGTGAVTPVRASLVDLGVDLAVCTDDGIAYWRDAALAIDAGLPLVVVNHPVSEEAAMATLADTLRDALAPVPVHHLPQRCMYRLVAP